MFITYPEEHEHSPQYRRKPLCNGASTGYQCQYYWGCWSYGQAQNPLFMNAGERTRICTLPCDGMPFESRSLGEGGDALSWRCSRYVPSAQPYDPIIESQEPLGPPVVLPPLRPWQVLLQSILRFFGVRVWYRGENWLPPRPLATRVDPQIDPSGIAGGMADLKREAHARVQQIIDEQQAKPAAGQTTLEELARGDVTAEEMARLAGADPAVNVDHLARGEVTKEEITRLTGRDPLVDVEKMLRGTLTKDEEAALCAPVCTVPPPVCLDPPPPCPDPTPPAETTSAADAPTTKTKE